MTTDTAQVARDAIRELVRCAIDVKIVAERRPPGTPQELIGELRALQAQIGAVARTQARRAAELGRPAEAVMWELVLR